MLETINNRIMHLILELEKEYKIKILFMVDTGSRATNLHSDSSDYDLRFIYCHTLDWYLSLNDNKDVIEYVNEPIDCVGWELRKALKLFYKCNPSLLEWLQSSVIYKDENGFRNELSLLIKDYYSIDSRIHHSLRMAITNEQIYLQNEQEINIKAYLNVLRPILSCMWTEQKNTIPPLDFKLLVNELIDDYKIKVELEQLIHLKQNYTHKSILPNPIFHQFINEKIHYYKNYLNTINTNKTTSIEQLNQLFRKTLYSVWK